MLEVLLENAIFYINKRFCMMNAEKVGDFFRKNSFWSGLVLGFTACLWLMKEFRIDQIREKYEILIEDKTRKINLLADTIKTMQDFENQFNQDRLQLKSVDNKCNLLERERDDLLYRLSTLESMKWEDKYKNEKLAALSAVEEATFLRQQLSNAINSVTIADPELVKQLSFLNKQNDSLLKERDELKRLYVGDGSSAPPVFLTAEHFTKKILLVSEKRKNHIDRINQSVDKIFNMFRFCLTVDMVNVVIDYQKKNKSDADKILYEYFAHCVACLQSINAFHMNALLEIYDESERFLNTNAHLPDDIFLNAQNSIPATLRKVDKLTGVITGIDMKQKNLIIKITNSLNSNISN